MIKQQQQTFNDGIVKIYEVTDISAPGDKPVDGLEHKLTLRYRRRTVGMSRYYTAMQANVQIDKLIRCQAHEDVSSQDVAIIGNTQYRIGQIQYPEDTVPPVMDLTLTKLVQKYEIGENQKDS